MNISVIKSFTLGLALAASTITASAQKQYTEGLITYNINMRGHDVEAQSYFKGDTASISYQGGPAKITMIVAKTDYMAILVSVPVASVKKAAVATPGDLEEMAGDIPEYAFTATTETQNISGFNCKKYIAKDVKTNATYDLWITTDISIPASNIMNKEFASLKGVPVMFTHIYQNIPQTVTLKSISDVKVPADAFKVPADYDKISMDDMKAMGGGKH